MEAFYGEDSRRPSQQWTGHSRVSVPTWIRTQWSSHYGRITRAILTLSTNKYIQKVQYTPRYTWTSAQPTHTKTAVRNNCSDGKTNYWIPLNFVHPSRLSQRKINFYAPASNLRHIKDAGFTTFHRQRSELRESEGGVWGWNAIAWQLQSRLRNEVKFFPYRYNVRDPTWYKIIVRVICRASPTAPVDLLCGSSSQLTGVSLETVFTQVT